MSSDNVFKSAKWFRDRYQVCSGTLRNWAIAGKLECVTFAGGKRVYNCAQFARLTGAPTPDEATRAPAKHNYIYARVSSKKQEQDLARQIEVLKETYPNHTVIHDIASGINFKRRGLRSLLDKCFKGVVRQVVVLHRDRLSRFATDLLDLIFANLGIELVVHGQSQDLKGPDADLADDLLAAVTVFVASHHGRRAAENNRRRRRRNNDNPDQATEDVNPAKRAHQPATGTGSS